MIARMYDMQQLTGTHNGAQSMLAILGIDWQFDFKDAFAVHLQTVCDPV